VNWGIDHVASWSSANPAHEEFRRELLARGNDWLTAPETAKEKSGIAQFTHDDCEVTVIRRVTVTSVLGMTMPKWMTEAVLIEGQASTSFVFSSRGFVSLEGSNGAGTSKDPGDLNFARELEAILEPLREKISLSADASVNEIVQLLESDDRQRFVMVVGPGGHEGFSQDQLESVPAIIGLTAKVIPIDWQVWEDLNEELGISFTIPADGFRLFAPGFNLENVMDARRHSVLRSLPPGIMSDEVTPSIRGVLSKIRQTYLQSIQVSANAMVSQILRDSIATEFRALERAQLNEANVAALGPSTPVSSDLKNRLDELTGQLIFANDYAAYWEGQATDKDLALADLHADLFVTDAALTDERRSNAYLRRLLADQGIFGVAEEAPEDLWAEVPNSCMELLARFPELPFLRFTGSEDVVRYLDAHPRIDVAISRAWDALHGLSDYARLKDDDKFAGGLHEYITTGDHNGHKFGANALAMSEGQQVNVNPAYRDARVFPVPEEVSGGGTAFMESHIRLMTGSANSPRMHFLDNTGGDGLIYVGYLGRHLPSPLSN
jgi:hypothetical protein